MLCLQKFIDYVGELLQAYVDRREQVDSWYMDILFANYYGLHEFSVDLELCFEHLDWYDLVQNLLFALCGTLFC